MALIDVECGACGRREPVYRAAADWPKTPACSQCGEATEQVHLPSWERPRSIDPVVVYQAPDGTYRFPPNIETASTKMYDDLGYTRHEFRGAHEVRKLEGKIEQQQMSDIRRRVERQQEQHERSEKERRSEIRRCLEQGFQVPEQDERGVFTGRMKTVRLSPTARAVMAAAIQRNDAKGGPKVRESGFHVEAYAYDRSNRAPDPRRRGQ
jgi:hypothetical protein